MPGERDRQRIAPLPPMGWVDIHRPQRGCVHPSAENTAARENDSMWSVGFYDGHFDVALEGGAFDFEPGHGGQA